VLFSPVHLEGASGGAGLAPLAVRPEHQGKGIVVLADPAYYGRFGFRRAHDLGLGNEYGAHHEFMVLELEPGALGGVRGVVKYCGEFAQLG
jgi:putative acetyltransferase